ncbi:MAG: hypothetical protein M1812_005868 [Candelaria pacifica]|nr:MAG: hypothetical protein M1812_005868 [Candelaria pacifica]
MQPGKHMVLVSMLLSNLCAAAPYFGQEGCAGAVPKYSVDSQKVVAGDAVTGSTSCKGSDSGPEGACSITKSGSFSTAVAITVGANVGDGLDFAKIATQLQFSVAITKSKGSDAGVSQECPVGPWSCSLSIQPAMVEVSGFYSRGNYYCETEKTPYTIRFPKKGADGIESFHTELCVCKNLPGWADRSPNVPKLPCPQDCSP